MKQFSKVIIWGHKLDTHTHSYIHYGFYRTFKYLRYDTYWFDNQDDISNINFDNCLFLTERQVEQNIPLSKNSKYISHSISISEDPHPYTPNLIIDMMQINNITPNLEKISDFIYVDSAANILIQPWATDILPHEFDFTAAILPRNPEAYFFGTVVASGWNNNCKEIEDFETACAVKNIQFDYRGLYTKGAVSTEKCIELTKKACAAPVIQSAEQIEAGYIPCRIFKNISYGHYGLTNSEAVYNLFKAYIPDLIYDVPLNMLDKLFELKNRDLNNHILLDQMKYIQNNHTYINRINTILENL
jgi:hypothetical protein